MSNLVVRPLVDGLLPAAARLLAERQRRLHGVEPAFAEAWADEGAARRRIGALLAEDGASAWAAMDGSRLVGYLVGALRTEAPWERAGWVELAGHAAEPSHPEAVGDLFAAWSTALVHELAVFRFLVNVPMHEASTLEAWHQLNFGQMHAFGARGTDASDLGPAAGIRVRRATAADAGLLRTAADVIGQEQAGPPSWSPLLPERVAANRDDYVSELDEPEDAVFVAEDAATGEPLGYSITYPLDPDLDVPEDNMKLAATGTFPAARRRGVARELLRAVLINAEAAGAAWCVTDWRTSSLLASRAWTGLGFRRTRVRLERRLDERIAWADGRV